MFSLDHDLGGHFILSSWLLLFTCSYLCWAVGGAGLGGGLEVSCIPPLYYEILNLVLPI